MKRILALCAMALMALTVFAASSCAQDKGPRPSPAGQGASARWPMARRSRSIIRVRA